MNIKTATKKGSNAHRNRVRDPFYQSKQYKAWRKEVIAQSNGCCVHCRDPKIKNENGTYARIVKPGKVTDHIIPIKKGGAKLDVSNGQYLCSYHNNVKTAKDK
ncbi:MAG: HNH endonuclease [bacterium]|nr:HNH endonuclease [bacterium]